MNFAACRVGFLDELRETLLETELFGYVKGPFPGAVKDYEGRFCAADGGKLLLFWQNIERRPTARTSFN
jgi:DNA-binding NtrC family response regulator